MAKHHPTLDFLTDYAASTLPTAQAACVSAHTAYCDSCRRTTEQLQDIGGALFAKLAPVAVSESVVDCVLAKLDEPAPLSYSNSRDAASKSPGLPTLLTRIINGDFSELVWKRVTKYLNVSYLKTGDTAHEFALYRIGAGGRIPEHNHGGSEMTLVLQGGFADDSGVYHPGDFVYRQATDTHAPVAIDGEDCICLAVLDAPLHFTQWQHRWLNPLLRLAAG